MIDRIEAVIAPHDASPAAYPNAAIYIVEGGRPFLHVVHGRRDALALCHAKRARTRDERFDLAIRLIEGSILPEQGTHLDQVFDGAMTDRIIDTVFKLLPHMEGLKDHVFAVTSRCDAFLAPLAPEVTEGLASFRTPSEFFFGTFRSLGQAEEILARYGHLLTEEEGQESREDLAWSSLPAHVAGPSPAIGGYLAALLGGCFRLIRDLGQAARGRP